MHIVFITKIYRKFKYLYSVIAYIYKLEIVPTSDGASFDFSAGAYDFHSISKRAEMPWRLIPTNFPNVLSRGSYNKIGNSAAVLSDPRLRRKF